MSDSEEFVNLEDILEAHKQDVDFKDDNFDKDQELEDTGSLVYQIQGEDNLDIGFIQEVGIFTKTPGVLINQFDMSTTVRCILSSCFYNKYELKNIADNCQFAMLKMLVNYNNGKTLNPIGCLLVNFNSFEHKSKKKSITEYTSNRSNKKQLKGFWTISFHYKEKKILLQKYKNYLGNKKMIDQLMKYLLDSHVQSIIEELIKAF